MSTHHWDLTKVSRVPSHIYIEFQIGGGCVCWWVGGYPGGIPLLQCFRGTRCPGFSEPLARSLWSTCDSQGQEPKCCSAPETFGDLSVILSEIPSPVAEEGEITGLSSRGAI